MQKQQKKNLDEKNTNCSVHKNSQQKSLYLYFKCTELL